MLLHAFAAILALAQPAIAAPVEPVWVNWLGASATTAIGALPGDGSVRPGDGSVIPSGGAIARDGSVRPFDRASLLCDGSVRPGDGSVLPGDGSVLVALTGGPTRLSGPDSPFIQMFGDGSVRTLSLGLGVEGLFIAFLGLGAGDARTILGGLPAVLLGDGSVRPPAGDALVFHLDGTFRSLQLGLPLAADAAPFSVAVGIGPDALRIVPVPLPAAGLLLAALLAAGGAAAWRRRGAA